MPLGACVGLGLAVTSFPRHGGSQFGAGKHEVTHKKQEGEEPADTCGPVSPALLLLDPSQFCELINPLLCNTV